MIAKQKGLLFKLLLLIMAFVVVSLVAFGTGSKTDVSEVPEEENVIKFGCLGVMSGPYAGWGGVMKQTFMAFAEMKNEQGGIDIGGKKYMIEVVPFDVVVEPTTQEVGLEILINVPFVNIDCLVPNVRLQAAGAD